MNSRDLVPEIERIVAEELARSKAPGFAARLMQHDDVILAINHTLARVDPLVPVDEQTVFRWGSVSKRFTCVESFQLWERGLVGLDETVNNYLQQVSTVLNGKVHAKRRGDT